MFDEAIIDSTTMEAHWHEGGQKGGSGQKSIARRDERESPFCGDQRRRACLRLSKRGPKRCQGCVGHTRTLRTWELRLQQRPAFAASRIKGNVLVIPGHTNRKAPIGHGEKRRKKRGLVERIFGKSKKSRRLMSRHEKSSASFPGFAPFAFLKIFLY